MLTGPERALRALSWALFATSLGFVGVYLYAGLIDDADYPFTVNSVAKDLLLAGLALLVARDVRRFASIGVPLIVMAHLALAGRARAHLVRRAATRRPTRWRRLAWPWLAADLVIAAVFIVVSFLAVRARYDLRYLSPSGVPRADGARRGARATQDRDVPPEEVGARVDPYLASFRAQREDEGLGLAPAARLLAARHAAPAVPPDVARHAPALGAAPLPRRRRG